MKDFTDLGIGEFNIINCLIPQYLKTSTPKSLNFINRSAHAPTPA
jgi:hypothetical protein